MSIWESKIERHEPGAAIADYVKFLGSRHIKIETKYKGQDDQFEFEAWLIQLILFFNKLRLNSEDDAEAVTPAEGIKQHLKQMKPKKA